MYPTTRHIITLFGWWCTISLTTGDNNNQEIRGLLDSILSSSSQGEPSINIGSRAASGEGETLTNLDSSNEVTTNRFNFSHDSNFVTTYPTTVDSTTVDYEVPEPILLAKKHIKSRVRSEREQEKSHIDAKETRKAQVKDVLLRKLRLEQLPTPRMSDFYMRFPHHLLDGVGGGRMQMDEPEREDDFHAKIQEMIRFSQQVPQDKQTRISSDRLSSTMYFPMPFSLSEKSLEKATLLVYIDTPAGYEDRLVKLNVLTNRWSKYISSKRVALSKGGHWQHFDITDECRSWLRNEWKNNVGVVVEAEIAAGVNLITYNSSHVASNNSLERIPLVKLELNEQEYNKRNRRSANSDLPLTCIPDDNENRCCKYPFVLDFDELGPEFNFIISPKRYWANYCKGVCPDYVLPNNANIQLTRGVNKAQRCCSPSSVGSLTLIYLNDDSDIMKGVIPGMSINSCGCE